MIQILAVLCCLQGADGRLIHSMDDLTVRAVSEKGKAETVDGKFGKAVRFTYADGCRNAFVTSRIRGTPEWDESAGFSFWVRGDGSKRFGGLQFIWNEDYGARYDYMFPIDSTEWRKIVVPWRDLVPGMPKTGAKFLGTRKGNAPSKFSTLWFGKWWYWRDYGAHSFVIDEIRLEPKIDLDTNDYLPSGGPLDRIRAKVKAGKRVTIVTMGDSLTDTNHWANKPLNWPTLLAKGLKEKHGADVRIVNPAIGGTQLRQNLVLMPRWLAEAPEPDLVTVCFGYNDWSAGMRGPMFRETVREAIDRIRRATRGKADVLFLTTAPAMGRWTTMGELAAAVRSGAAERKAGVADVEKAFHSTPEGDREKLFCRDKVHLGPVGHETVARTVIEAIQSAGK